MTWRAFCLLSVGVSFCLRGETVSPPPDRWSRAEAERLFADWCDGLFALQMRGTGRTEFDGALGCPACGFLHGRAGDAAYPFVRRYVRTGESKWLAAAEAVVDWTERNFVREGGCYLNDYQSSWCFTTLFSQIALARTLLRYGDRLPSATRERWRGICLRLTNWVWETFASGRRANVNYRAAFVESMALTWKLTGEAKFRDEAVRLAKEEVLTRINADGLLWGEGHPIDGESATRGLKFIDIGYNLEESLPALAAASEILGDAEIASAVEASARAHAAFVLPDGAIDNSAGARSVKWTYYGSRTSDGALSLWGWCARRGVPWGVRAIGRTLSLLRSCTGADGLLAGGLDYAEAGEPACTHHTFTHVKALVELLEEGAPEEAPPALLPREREYGLRHVASMGVYLVSVGPWRATFSANDQPKGDRRAMCGGGAPTVLWHAARGLVAAGTMAKFYWLEAHNMQNTRQSLTIRCATPRLVGTKEGREFTNVCDARVRVESSFSNGVYVARTSGQLTAAEPGRLVTDAPYEITYRLSRDGLTITSVCAAPDVRFVLPVRTAAQTTPEGASRRDDGTFFTPIAGLLCREWSFPATSAITMP